MDHLNLVITGSSGLIGSAIVHRLESQNVSVVGLDLRPTAGRPAVDIADPAAFDGLLEDADGIIHLAALSRVIPAENDPARCHEVNVAATKRLLDAALAAPRQPFVVYASSREVYGQQSSFPVAEDAPLGPMNVYARSKLAAEHLCGEARAAGLATAIIRFSTAYGSVDDHATRVVPAFISAAMRGESLRIDGTSGELDLTHVDDVAQGVLAIAQCLAAGEMALPPIHFVSGTGTTLLALAETAIRLGGNRSGLVVAPPRDFDVSRFIGDPRRAEALLGWRATTPPEVGLARLAADFAARFEGGGATSVDRPDG